MFLSFSLSVYPNYCCSLCLSVLSHYISFSPPVFSLSLCLSISPYLPFYLTISSSFCLSLSISLSVCLFISPYLLLSVCLCPLLSPVHISRYICCSFFCDSHISLSCLFTMSISLRLPITLHFYISAYLSRYIFSSCLSVSLDLFLVVCQFQPGFSYHSPANSIL